MKRSAAHLFAWSGLLLGLIAQPTFAGKVLISTELSGNGVSFLQQIAGSTLELRALAEASKGHLKEEPIREFVGSMVGEIDQQMANVVLLAKNNGVVLPAEPTGAATQHLKKMQSAGMTDSRFLAEVIRLRSDQLKTIQLAGESQSGPIRNFAGALVQSIQDELIFIQLISARSEKEARQASPSSTPAAAKP